MEKKLDLRIVKTYSKLREALSQMMHEMKFDEITVYDLCLRAKIRRATFYKHYLDIPDLLEKLEEELFTQIRSAFENHIVSPKTYLMEILTYIHRESDRFIILSSNNADPNLMTKTFLICYEGIYPLLKDNLPKIEDQQRKMLYSFLSYGSGGILTQWIKGGMQQSPSEVSDFILTLCDHTVRQF